MSTEPLKVACFYALAEVFILKWLGQDGAVLVATHSKELAAKERMPTKKTPVWRLAFPETNRTFTQELMYHGGIELSRASCRENEGFLESSGLASMCLLWTI
jgi:hypothetical protein